MAHALREKAAISGIGETAYTRGTPKSGLALQLEASLTRSTTPACRPRDIDGVVPYFPGGGIAEDFIANLGLPDLTLSLFVPMGGATCVAAIQSAAMAVATGVCKHVLISVGRTGYSGARVSTRLQQFPQFALAAEFEAPIGMFAPAQLYAQGARRHMELYGTTARHFAEVAVVDAPARDPQRQRRDEQAAHRRGASRLAHDLRSVPAVRLQPGERRRRGHHRQRAPTARAI